MSIQDETGLRQGATRSPNYPRSPDDWREFPVVDGEGELLIGGWQVMQEWERPLMSVLANAVAGMDRDVLEVGWGMGISASEIASIGCRSYSVIEAHPVIAERAHAWGQEQPFPVRVIEGLWQDVVGSLDRQFDSILFDTYPLSAMERGQNHFEFIPFAAALLRQDGVFTAYSDETLDFRSSHLRLLFDSFSEVRLIRVDNLVPPLDCEYWSESTMVIPVASKPRTRATSIPPPNYK